MQLLVTADTHIPRRAAQLPSILIEYAQRADHILHAGDFVDIEVWQQLSLYAPLSGVAGNNEIGILKLGLPLQLTLQFERTRIGLVHGHQGKGKTTLERANNTFAAGSIDILVFGHSHKPYGAWHGNRLLLNPGSPTDRRRQPHYSFLWLMIQGREVDYRWVRYERKD